MEPERIPFHELDRMVDGEIPMTEEGKTEIEKWKKIVGPPLNLGFMEQEKLVFSTSQIDSALIPSSVKIFHGISANILEKQSAIAKALEEFRESMGPLREQSKYISEQLLSIKTTSIEVYKNEKRFYKKKFGMKIPYEQFWNLYMKKHGGRSISDVLANTNYESIAMDYAEFIAKRIKVREAAVIETKQFDANVLSPLSLESGWENTFNEMPVEEVINYFMQLASELSSNKEPFLTDEEVRKFVGRAFCKKDDFPILTLNYAKGEKQFVWSLFYKFYVKSTNNYQYESSVKCKDKYIDLLVNNFTNFNRKEVIDNFHKPVRRTWPITK